MIDGASAGDLIFADPPYTVRHNNNSFIKYNEKLFSWNDQVRLSNCLKRAAQRGALIIATNAHHQSIIELYRDGWVSTTVHLPQEPDFREQEVSREL